MPHSRSESSRSKLPRTSRGRRRWLAEHLHATITRLARRETMAGAAPNLLSWGRRYLPRHFRLPPSKLHRWLANEVDQFSTERGRKINVIGPRGGAKSTIGSLALVLRAAVEAQEPYIWIVSDTKHQAAAHLENVRKELVDNARLAADYPQACGIGSVWRGQAIVLRNGVAIEAFGTGQSVRGRRYGAHRPTLIVCDDLQNDGHVLSARLRETSRRWFHGTLMKAGTKRTCVVNLATALHREALAMELHAGAGWRSQIFRAIETWPHNLPLWDAWEAIYCDRDEPHADQRARQFFELHRPAMQAGAELLWPEEEDLYTLMCLRVEGGRTAFEREKQGAPVSAESCEWPEDYFGDWLWFHDWPRDLAVQTIALDPSKGQGDERGDYSAIVLVGVDSAGTIYAEADLARRGTPQMIVDTVAHCARFRPHALGVESNQFQQLLAGELLAALQRARLPGITPWEIDNRVNKLVRIRRLGPLLSTRRLRLKAGSPSTRLLCRQLQDFPAADHDDGPDALEMALRLAEALAHGSQVGDDLGTRLTL